MVNILSRTTVGNHAILVVDAAPTGGGGVVALPGSLAIFNDSGTGRDFRKTGTGDTAWTEILTATTPNQDRALSATFINPSAGDVAYVRAPFTGTITAAEVVADVSGSIVIDIWKDVYGSFPPTIADTIVASAKPTLSTAQTSTDSTLTGWTTSVTKGDYLFFHVDSVSTLTKALVTLKVTAS